MKILQLIKALDRGGAEVLLVETCRLLRERGHSVEVAWFMPQHRRVVADLERIGVTPICLEASSPAAIVGSAITLAALLRRLRPDVVHAHLPLAGAVARIAAATLGIPVVYTEHNVFDRYHPLTRLISTATWPLQAHVVAVSEDVARTLPRGARSSVVRNGVQTRRFAATPAQRVQARRDLGCEETDIVVGTVAVFRPAKRLDRLVDVVGQLIALRPQVRCVIAGYGPLEAEVRSAVETSPARNRINLLGARDDVAEVLPALDVYLMTSSHEGLPIALLEAMAAGRCVVATPVGGIPEVLADGVDGRLVELDGLLSALVAVVDDPSCRDRMGASAAARVTRERGIERTIDALIDIYNDVRT